MKIKKLILIGTLLVASGAHAEKVMSVITDTGRAIPVSQVECLIASDGDSSMAILLTDGLTLSGIDHVKFGMADPAALDDLQAQGQAITIVNQSIIITGAKSGAEVAVSDLAGRTILAATTDSDQCVIDASALTSGQCYIVTVNGKSTKIIKR